MRQAVIYLRVPTIDQTTGGFLSELHALKIEEGGCRVTSKQDYRVPAERREKTSLPGRWRW